MKFEINVKSPLLISSSDYLNLSEVLRNGNEIYMLDINKLIYENKNMINKLKKIFMNYYNRDINESFNELQNQYRSINNIDRYKIYPAIKYNRLDIKKSDIKMPIGNYVNEDNKIFFRPFIPGSSIKGAIRNAVRNTYIKNKGASLKIYIDNNFALYKFKGSNSKNLDDLLFYYNDSEKGKYDAKYDIFKFFEISDFNPEDYELTIFEMSRSKQNIKGVPSYAVAISSGKFKGDILISKQLDYIYKNNKEEFYKICEKISDVFDVKFKNDLDEYKNEIIHSIMKMTYEHYKDIIKNESNYYQNVDNPMILGFGGGIEEKTIISSLNDNTFNIVKKFIENKNSSKKNKMKFKSNRMPATVWIVNRRKLGLVSINKL
ncbi:type III-A CRISPR-associated RAMP protein Csm5 [Picrophilus oshimae]|uniref:CRISPR system Cms protein Csm5 n=1 Tax=Picrophilus torridus (strain ATCC 700027 / DSM 9790 / JCM 10055 / NBRC 100828 / KAW 2/3) TaxID=1122961 RepID=Q6L316_PICTO|nr:type III-A CRISPR-associated RAMP protein Csm5 [Picrophilus oshimae]AAT42635.1 hypothetical protein PTO0050 [Picrophilus oshimae DSM 9789]